MPSTEGSRRRHVRLDEELRCECPVCEPNTFSFFDCLLLQQTSDNAVNMRDIERRVQSLYGVLASPVGEDDHAENARRVELRRFVLVYMHVRLLISPPGSSTGLSQSLNHSLKNTHF